MLAGIDDYDLAIPFRVEFRHASAVRAETSAVLVRAHTDNNIIGWGEGCPRDYVTNESIAGARSFISEYRGSLIQHIDDLDSLYAWVNCHKVDMDRNPAAWCALELALLDALSRSAGQPVETYLGLPFLQGDFIYTAVIGSAGEKQFSAILDSYRKLGLSDYKIKLSGNFEADKVNIAYLKDAESSVKRVRLDANNLWDDVKQAVDYLEQLDYPFFAIEEPLGAGRFDDLETLGKKTGLKIILDESILRAEQIPELGNAPDRWIVNLRVSKMGGLLRSLNVAEACRRYNIPMIVGAQVGETSLLTRAALTVINACRDRIIACEGAFGTYLLESDPFKPTLMFGKTGVLDANIPLLAGTPGLGLKADREVISL